MIRNKAAAFCQFCRKLRDIHIMPKGDRTNTHTSRTVSPRRVQHHKLEEFTLCMCKAQPQVTVLVQINGHWCLELPWGENGKFAVSLRGVINGE